MYGERLVKCCMLLAISMIIRLAMEKFCNFPVTTKFKKYRRSLLCIARGNLWLMSCFLRRSTRRAFEDHVHQGTPLFRTPFCLPKSSASYQYFCFNSTCKTPLSVNRAKSAKLQSVEFSISGNLFYCSLTEASICWFISRQCACYKVVITDMNMEHVLAWTFTTEWCASLASACFDHWFLAFHSGHPQPSGSTAHTKNVVTQLLWTSNQAVRGDVGLSLVGPAHCVAPVWMLQRWIIWISYGGWI